MLQFYQALRQQQYDGPSPLGDCISIARLEEAGIDREKWADPWGSGFQPKMVFEGEDLCREPFASNDWDQEWEDWSPEKHAARVRFIMQSPETLEASITLDCECHNGWILPTPVVLDGWHRLHAHWALGRQTINAEFGGRIDLWDYLRGVSDKLPED
jgi:hypothetical protein